MKTVTLDLHDFSVENNNLFYIDKLKEQYPDLKVSMFYIPVDSNFGARLMPEMKEVAKEMIKKRVNEGWIELIPHGITHVPGEFLNATYEDMELAIKAYEEHFNELGLPYVKGFCAPNWLMSKDAIKCLDDNGWFLATDRNQPESPKAKRDYVYNWDIAYPFPEQLEQVKGHGHISEPSANNLPGSIVNLTRIPPGYKWKFVSEVMDEN